MYKILSVDDEPINQAIVEELFSSNFEVALASSGEECLQNINNIKPDLILLDVSMQGMDGYDTCRELKKLENVCDIPVIFVSARGTLEDKIKGYEAGGHDYITKPFNHSELEVKIKQIIEAATQAQTTEQKPDE
jgi:DNA-binding response OmpR family regulator